MPTAVSWRPRFERILKDDPSRIAIGLGILFVLGSLVLPFWSLASDQGTDREINSFSWSTITTERYVGGVWSETTTLPYTSSRFTYPDVAGVAANAYLLEVVFLLVLGAILGLFLLGYGRALPTFSLLIVSLIVLASALFALFYPIIAVPGAATTDRGNFTVGGFWGSASLGPAVWSWGPGLGWWLLLVGVVLGLVGTVLPYVKSIRAMVRSTPVSTRPSS